MTHEEMKRRVLLLGTIVFVSAGFLIFVSTLHADNPYGLIQDQGLGQSDGDSFDASSDDPNQNEVGFPNATGFRGPRGSAIDSTGHRLFVADLTNNRVVVHQLDNANLLTDHIADYVLGQTDFQSSVDGEDAGASVLSGPTDVAFDDDHDRLFVADSGNCRVVVFDLSGGITSGTDASWVLGQDDLDSRECPGTSATRFSSAINSLDYDAPNQRLFVSDAGNNRVLVFDVTGTITSPEPAVAVIGQDDFITNGNSAVTATRFVRPWGLAYDPTGDRLFVADADGLAVSGNRVLVFDASVANLASEADGLGVSTNAVNVLGHPDFTNDDPPPFTPNSQQLVFPYALEIDSSGLQQRLFVSEFYDFRVVVFDVTTVADYEPAVAVLGQDTLTSADFGPSQDTLEAPVGLAYDPLADRLYVSDASADRVMIFDVFDPFTDGDDAVDMLGQIDYTDTPDYTATGFNNLTYPPQGPLANNLSAPTGVAVDETNHRIYAADSANNRVLMYNLDDDQTIDDMSADIVLGQDDFSTAASGSGQSALDGPTEIALDVAGNRLFVSDRGNNRVLVYETSALTDGQDAARVLGQVAFGTDIAGSGAIGMNAPAGLAYSAETNSLFVTDAGNHRVLVFDVGTTIADITNGQSADAVLGQDTYLTSAPATTADGLSTPDRLALDNTGNRLFVSDTTNNRVMVFDVEAVANGEDAIAAIGQSDFTSAGAAVTADGLTAPGGIAYDSDRGYLFVGDTGSFRTMIYDAVTLASFGEDAVAVFGQADFVSAVDPTGAPSAQAELTPSGLAFDVTARRLYMADSGFNRIAAYALVRLGGTLPDGAQTISYSGELEVAGVQSVATYAVISGALPPGLTVEDGFLSGTPTTAGTYEFTLRISDTDDWGELDYEWSYTMTIFAVTSAYNSAALLGSTNDDLGPYYGDSGPYDTPNHIGLHGPEFTLVDTAGHRLFVSESDNNRVLVFNLTASNDLVDRLADAVLGQPDFKSNDSNTTQSGFRSPGGMVLASGNRLFVSDRLNNRVLVFDVAVVDNGEGAINVLGQPDFETPDLVTSQEGLGEPMGLAYDASPGAQRLFVAEDDNRRVTVFDVTAITNGESAINVLGQPDFITAVDLPTRDGMQSPRGVAYDSVNDVLFVSDALYNRVTTYDVDPAVLIPNDPPSDGPNALNVLGQEDFTSVGFATTQDTMQAPTGLSYDAGPGAERLFVADVLNARVMIFDLSGGISDGMDASSVLGQDTFLTLTPETSVDGFNLPRGVDYDATTDRLYVADRNNSRIMVFDVDIITNGEDAVDEVGHLGADGEVRYDVASANDAPNNRGFDFTAVGGCAVTDTVHHRLFVCSGKRVHVLDLDANNEPLDALADHVIGAPDFSLEFSGISSVSMTDPSDLAYDAVNDRLFVSDYEDSRVLVFDTATITDGEPAINVLGQDNFTSDTESALIDGMTGPSAVAFDTATQRLFMTDHQAGRLQVFDVDPNVLIPNDSGSDGPDSINVVQGAGVQFVSQSNFSFSSGHAGYAGLTIDAARQLMFLNDSGNSRIIIVPIDTATLVPNGSTTISASGVLGQPDFDTRTEGVTQSKIGYGGGELVYDSSSKLLFVTDKKNSRVLGFDVTTPSSAGVPASFVIGQLSFITETGSTNTNSVANPNDIVFDSVRRRLLVTRRQANSIITFDLVRIPAQSFPTLTVGVPVDEDIVTENSQGTVTFELVSGTLPPGLSLGSLTGTPTTPGTYMFTVQANDDNGPIGVMYDQEAFIVTVLPGAGAGGGGVIPPPSATSTPPAGGGPTTGRTPTPRPAPPTLGVAGPQPSLSPVPGSPTSPGVNSPTGLPSVINRTLGARGIPEAVAAASTLIAAISIGAIVLSAIMLSRNLLDLAFLLGFALQNMLVVLGVKRRAHIWGTVYDSSTKHPVPFAKIELIDASGRVVETRFADRDGRYGFLTGSKEMQKSALTVSMKPMASGYVFPPVRVPSGTTDFLVYEHVYAGGPLTVEADSFLHYNIPMDRQVGQAPRFSEFQPLKSAGSFMAYLLNIAFWAGLILVPLAYWQHPSTLNLVVLILFLGVHALRLLTGMYRPFGVVRDGGTKKAVPYALVTLNDSQGKRRGFAVSDEQGRYFMSLEGGTYQLQTFTPANVSPQRTNTATVKSRSGWIRKGLTV